MAANKDEAVAFGMTLNQVDEATKSLLKHKDHNCPKRSGSYEDFLEVKNLGHKALLAQENYGKVDNN